MTLEKETAQPFYETLYGSERTKGIRRYPHEDMMRFLGRHYFQDGSGEKFFSFNRPSRRGIRILEVGCGAGSNLWAIAKEGFSAHGIDASADGLAICKEMLAMWDVNAKLEVADMCCLPFADGFFNAIIDVYTSCCLRHADFAIFLAEVARTLKPGGRFFCWNPSAESDAYKNHAPARVIEPYTLDGINRETSPFYGNNYPFRFLTPETVAQAFERAGLTLVEIERSSRTYRQTEEYFEWLSVSAIKSV